MFFSWQNGGTEIRIRLVANRSVAQFFSFSRQIFDPNWLNFGFPQTNYRMQIQMDQSQSVKKRNKSDYVQFLGIVKIIKSATRYHQKQPTKSVHQNRREKHVRNKNISLNFYPLISVIPWINSRRKFFFCLQQKLFRGDRNGGRGGSGGKEEGIAGEGEVRWEEKGKKRREEKGKRVFLNQN